MPTLVGSIILPARRWARGRVHPSRIWGPLTHGLFLAFLGGSLVGGVGARMSEIAFIWLMTGLTTSPFLISLVTAMLSLPGFLLALPAGVMGDVFDRHRVLLWTQSGASAVMAVLAFFSMKHLVTPVMVLAASAMIGFLSTIISTTMDAILPHVVERREFNAAIALTAIRYHLACAIGPVVGGVLIARASMGQALLVCAITPLALLAFLWAWRVPPPADTLPGEKMRAAFRSGVRYVRNAPRLAAALGRLVAFVIAGSAMWALLPIFIRQNLGLDALDYGILFGAFGLGGMLGSAAAFRWDKSQSTESVLGASTLAFAITLFLITTTHDLFELEVVLFFGGVAWSAGIVSLKTAIQTAAPDWVRARVSAIYLLALNGAVAAGSASWGLLASYHGTGGTLRIASVATALTVVLALRYRLSAVPAVIEDHPVPRIAPFELPGVLIEAPDPLMIALEYQVDPERMLEFEHLMNEVGGIRRRAGAVFWGLFGDSVPGRYQEYFVVECALDAMRMHDRMTDPEREMLSRAKALHAGGLPPIMRHRRMIC
jgi:predicted MFS family arabinose efflux permease